MASKHKKLGTTLKNKKKKSCWKGYKKVGTKIKNGNTVNNCVKE